jgi:DNA-binding transcriptional LysR family regulator
MSALPQHLDLHLIRILYLLLVEKNVSRVALKLNQPQPSISASLRKLRELTGDPLLVRGARGMVPTQHGESLLAPAKRILDETENLFLKKHLSCHRKRRAPSTSPRRTIWTASSCPIWWPCCAAARPTAA